MLRFSDEVLFDLRIFSEDHKSIKSIGLSKALFVKDLLREMKIDRMTTSFTTYNLREILLKILLLLLNHKS